MYFQNFLIDLFSNYFLFFTLELATLSFFRYHHPKQTRAFRYLFLGIHMIIALIPDIPYIILIGIALEYLYLCLVSSFRLKDSLIFCIKYEIFINLTTFLSGLFGAFFNFNLYVGAQDLTQPVYDYQDLTGIITIYIILNLYINARRLKKLHIRTLYPIAFFALSTAVIFLLLFLNRSFSKYADVMAVMPYLYLCIIGILVLSLHSYRNIIETVETQTAQKLTIEKYEMELSYFKDVQESLERLARLRHDFKNHLIVLDGYASQNRMEELQDYMKKINTELSGTKLYQTSNDLISSILNAKNMLCREKNVTFTASCDFDSLKISDFAIITILGNMLDNAVRAAADTEKGWVNLSLSQLDGYFEIICQNNYSGSVIEKNGAFTSTKGDTGGLHGFGIRNMRECVESLRGTCDIKYDDHTFNVSVLLPNY